MFHVKLPYPYRWMSERGVLLQAGAASLAVYQKLAAAALPDVEELVPADGSVLLVMRPGAGLPESLAQILAGVGEREAAVTNTIHAIQHEIPLVLDGEDLADIAEYAGWTLEQLTECLLGVELSVRFLGFQPGFAYLKGLPDNLKLPRRNRPRTRVVAGSVAVGGGYCGIYPAGGPGGWHVLGHTSISLFDPLASPPARLQPGDVVRFVAA